MDVSLCRSGVGLWVLRSFMATKQKIKKRKTTFVNRVSFSRRKMVGEEMKMWMLRIVVTLEIRRAGRRR